MRVQPAGALSPGDSPPGESLVQEGRLLLESLNGFALVVSAEGLIFYASATIVDYLGFHQTDVMHQNIYDYIHVDDRQDFCRQLHWAMDPPRMVCGQPPHTETDDTVLGRLLRAQEGGTGSPSEYSAFLTRCFICRVRCLLDSTSGFLTMQFQGKLKFLFGQKKKAPSGTALPPRLSLFCTVVPIILPSVAEMKMKSVFLRAKHRADIAVTSDPRAKSTMSLCGSELHRKPNYLAGRSNGENGISVFRAPTDGGHWTRVLARAPCLCFRGSPDPILDSEGATGDREEEEQERMLSDSARVRRQREMHRYNCHSETSAPERHLNWMTEQRGQEGSTKLRLQPSKSEPFPVRAMPHGSCMPYPGAQGTFSASGLATFRDLPDHPPSAYCSRMGRTFRDVYQGQVHPPTCHVSQGSLGTRLPPSGVQRFMAGGFSTEDAKLPSLPVPSDPPCNPALSLEVQIKMENDSGSQDTVDGRLPGRVWLGASDVAKGHLVTFPAKVNLKTEPDYTHQVCTQHSGHGMLGAHPHSRPTTGPCSELAPVYPAHCACMEPVPPHHLCTQGGRENQQPPLGCDCRAPGAAPVVKCEPIDSLPWAAPGQGAVPGMFPKSASMTLIPPRASEAAFLP